VLLRVLILPTLVLIDVEEGCCQFQMTFCHQLLDGKLGLGFQTDTDLNLVIVWTTVSAVIEIDLHFHSVWV
jgi:hypothetical protein